MKNNPVKYTDPDGHDAIGDFVLGFSSEFTRVNIWFHPQAQQALSVKESESDAMIVGRIAGDVVAAVVGAAEFADGVGIAGGGTAVACGTTMCLASVVPLAAGGAIALQGVGTGVNAGIGIVQNAAMLGGNNSSSSSSNPYPEVIDSRTGNRISKPPDGLKIVPEEQRVPWGAQERNQFIKEWYDQGYSMPEGGWAEYDIHHIVPREYGGSNDFWNLVPVRRNIHQQQLNPWWNRYGSTPR